MRIPYWRTWKQPNTVMTKACCSMWTGSLRKAQVKTSSCNTEIRLPPQEVVKQTQDGFKPGARRRWGLLEWPALLRKLDKIDPSYRD